MEILNILSQKGYRLTKPRLAVFKSLAKYHGIISAQDLYKKIKVVDRASVYRVLNLFEELDIVNAEVVNKEKLYCIADHPHHHIICRRCGYMEEFACTGREFKNLKNFINIQHQLTLTGLCNNCK